MVGAGAVAKKWLNEHFGVSIRGCMTALGEIEIPTCSALPPTRQMDGGIGAEAAQAGLSVVAATRVEPSGDSLVVVLEPYR